MAESNLERETTKTEIELNYGKLLKFFLPLGLTPLVISVTHSIVDAAIARLPYPVISLAVYGVVKSMTHMIASPTIMCRQLFISMVDDRDSYDLIFKFCWLMCALFVVILFIMAFTPLGGWFLKNVIGLTNPEEIRFAYIGLRISWVLPISEVLRNSNQALLISLEKTGVMFKGILLRLVGISLFLFIAVQTQFTSGMVAGSLVWVYGIGLEGVFVCSYLFYKYKRPSGVVELLETNGRARIGIRDVLKFFLPLSFMMIIGSFLFPLIQSGIARSLQEPAEALAAFAVGFGLTNILSGPIRMLNQCSLVYCDDMEDERWEIVSRFSNYCGLIIFFVMFFLGVFYPGFWIFRRVIGVEDFIARISQRVLLIMSFLPLIGAWREKYWGILMKDRDTSIIAQARGVNIAAVFITLLFLFGFNDLFNIYPSLIGAIAFLMGQLVEGFLVWNYARKIGH